MVQTRLFTSQIVLQIMVGTVVPLAPLAVTQLFTIPSATWLRIDTAAGVDGPGGVAGEGNRGAQAKA